MGIQFQEMDKHEIQITITESNRGSHEKVVCLEFPVLPFFLLGGAAFKIQCFCYRYTKLGDDKSWKGKANNN